MKRTRLSNKFIESKTDANRTAYNNVIIVRLICKKKRPMSVILRYVTLQKIKPFGEK